MERFLVYGLSNKWGGVESIVMTMIQCMADDNCYFDIILSEDYSSYEENYNSDKIHFVHIPSWGCDRKEFSKQLRKLLESKNYNYLWFNGCLMSNRTILSVTKRFSDARIITQSHGSSFEENNKLKRIALYAMHILNRRYYKANVDYPCMCSLMSGIWFYGRNYVKKHQVFHLKNGIDLRRFQFDNTVRNNYRMKLGLIDEFAVFHAGRLTKVKNQNKLLSVFVDFINTGIKARLFIAGDGELRTELECQAKRLGIDDKVCFLGKRNDINFIYQAMDVMVLPSFHEGFPVTLTEAQAAGLPCLVSDKITKETDISGLVQFFSIDNEDNRDWVAALKELTLMKPMKRNDYSTLLFNKGWDIRTICDEFIDYITTND